MDIDLLCELLLSSAVVVNREAVRRQLLLALKAKGFPESALEVLIQGFEWRDLARNQRRLIEDQSQRVYDTGREGSLELWEFFEEKRRQKEVWKSRWDASYWTPGNHVYDHFHGKK